MSGTSDNRAIRIRDARSYGRKTIARPDVEEAIVVSSINKKETQGTRANEKTVTSPVTLIASCEEEADSRQEAAAATVETPKAQSLFRAMTSR